MRPIYYLLLILFAGACRSTTVDVTHYKLRRVSGGYSIVEERVGRSLFIPDSVLAEPISEEGEVLEIEFDTTVGVFSISPQLLGVQLSAYDISEDGSMRLAEGFDRFIAWDTARHLLSGVLTPSQSTKGRVRSGGCWNAWYTRFYLADIDADGYADLGSSREEIICREYADEARGVEAFEGPYYRKNPVEWYRFDGARWQITRPGDYPPPRKTTELPMLSIRKSPVDYVKEILGKRLEMRE